MILTLYIILILVMTVTSPFCEATTISYISIIIPIIFFRRREFILALVLFSTVLFYRIPPGIPVMPLLIIIYIGSIIMGRIERLKWNVSLRALILFLASCGYITLSCYTSITGSYDSLFKMITFIALLYFSIYDKEYDTLLFQKLLLIASVIGTIYIFFILMVSPDMSIAGRYSISAFHNPNVVARGVVAMILIIFVSRRYWTKTLPNIILDGTMILGLISIFLTGSRMGILSTLITIVILLYVGSSDKKNRVIKFAFIGTILIGFFSVFLSMSNVWTNFSSKPLTVSELSFL